MFGMIATVAAAALAGAGSHDLYALTYRGRSPRRRVERTGGYAYFPPPRMSKRRSRRIHGKVKALLRTGRTADVREAERIMTSMSGDK